MKLNPSLFAALLCLITTAPLNSYAQTYTVSSNGQGWSSLVSASTCNNCTINIPSGYTLLINSNTTCNNCTFNGGTVNITSAGFNFNGTSKFSGVQILVNAATDFQGATFTNDTIKVNKSISFSQATTFTGSHVTVANNAGIDLSNNSTATNSVFALNGNATMETDNPFTSSGTNFYLTGTADLNLKNTAAFKDNSNIYLEDDATMTANNTISLNGGSLNLNDDAVFSAKNTFSSTNSNITSNDGAALNFTNTATITGGAVTLSDDATFTGKNTINFKDNTLTMNGNADLSGTNTIGFNNTDAFLNGNATLSTSNTMTLSNGSSMHIGDGTLASSANVTANNLNVQGGSLAVVNNYNNFLHAGTAKNTIHCNPTNPAQNLGYPHSCAAGFVYGCGTVSSSGPLACTVLAVAEIDLSVTTAGPGKTALSWYDSENGTTDHYQVQRNTGNDTWTTIGSVAAGGYSAGEYHFIDPAAPDGTDHYRILRIGKDGSTDYSPISSITIAGLSPISIFPNPVTGRTFYLATPSANSLAVSIFTLSGQLLLQVQLKGQKQYSLQLPAQTQTGSALVIRTTGQAGSQTFTLIIR